MEKEIPWHGFSGQEALKKLHSNRERGLTEEQAETRRRKFGRNILPQERKISQAEIFLEQFKSPLIYLLLIAGVVVLALRDFSDAVVIFAAVILNIIFGWLQERKATDALRKLRRTVSISAETLRSGYKKILDYAELVPGDIILLKAGDKVPADGRILESEFLKINEMALTGEWLAAEKKPSVLRKDLPMADRDNMVYMGTVVEEGRGGAVVTSTGMSTEIGRVASLVKKAREVKTPLQKKLARLSKIVGIIIVTMSLFIFVEGVIAGRDFLEMFTVAVAVSVAAIPEGLPVAMTVILALGMQRILKRKGLVRKLIAAETLGSTSIIATDKTLTLTEGKMRVSEIATAEGILNKEKGSQILALRIAALANEAFIENPEDTMERWVVRGQAMDKALLLAAVEAGINRKKLDEQFPQIEDISFDSSKKYTATLRRINRRNNILYAKGAPETILAMSNEAEIEGRNKKLTVSMRKKVEKSVDQMANRGLRVLAVGYRKRASSGSRADLEYAENLCSGLTFVGLIALKDPLRVGAKKAINLCRGAGMRPIMITGDHKLTAKAVAGEIGLDISDGGIIEAKDLDAMSEKEFAEKIKSISVYARMEPRHKLRIVRAWQLEGEVVAVTGDGINDAPALRQADIGVALGSGSEVAKEVSDLVLISDNFNIIVAAVEEGRAVLDNLRKVITYLLSDSFTETILVGAALLLGFPLPVAAAQILWVNLIEDGLPNIALAFEPKEEDLMRRKPEKSRVALMTREMRALVFIIGIATDVLLLSMFFWLLNYTNYELDRIRSVVFAGLAIDSLFYVFSARSLRQNIWHINFFSNRLLIFSWVFGIVALLAALYLPFLQSILKTVPLNPFDWALVLGLGFVNVSLIEATKWLFIAKKFKD